MAGRGRPRRDPARQATPPPPPPAVDEENGENTDVGNDPPAAGNPPVGAAADPGIANQIRDAVIAAMAGLFQGAAGAAGAPAPAVAAEDPLVRKQKAYRIFDRLIIQAFTGDGGSSAADYWLDDVQRKLHAAGIPPEFHIEFASHRLEGKALDWYRSLMSRENQAEMAWADFERHFCNQYFTRVYRQERVAEFMNLTQGNMTVTEYDAKFTELSRYARPLVADEEMRCIKFRENLRPNLRRLVSVLDCNIYSDLLACALRIEKDNTKFHQEQENSGRNQRSGGPMRRRDQRDQRGQGGYGGYGHGGPSISSQSRTSTGGASRSAPYAMGLCFGCGQPGHKKNACPQRSQSFQGQRSQPAVS